MPPMLTRSEAERLERLDQCCRLLLEWMRQRLGSEQLSFREAHRAWTDAQSVREWLARRRADTPGLGFLATADLRAVAALLDAELAASRFASSDDRGPGCSCRLCGGRHARQDPPILVTPLVARGRQASRTLRRDRLRAVAAHVAVLEDLSPETEAGFLRNRSQRAAERASAARSADELSAALDVLAYVHEVALRALGHGHEDVVRYFELRVRCALGRHGAGSPFAADDVLEAQEVIARALREERRPRG